VKIGRGIRQECCLSPILFNLYSECLTNEALEGYGDFKISGQIIHTVKYADALVLLAKEGKVLQGMIDILIETEVSQSVHFSLYGTSRCAVIK